mgnify:CR=1 FL=1
MNKLLVEMDGDLFMDWKVYCTSQNVTMKKAVSFLIAEALMSKRPIAHDVRGFVGDQYSI